MKLTNKFVTNIPENLENGILYISMEYATAIHRCACGCGNKVVTPLSPTDWQLYFDGKVVSLTPSIGNWSFPCQSHYFITNNEVKWVPKWSKKQIDDLRRTEELNRKKSTQDKKRWFNFFR